MLKRGGYEARALGDYSASVEEAYVVSGGFGAKALGDYSSSGS